VTDPEYAQPADPTAAEERAAGPGEATGHAGVDAALAALSEAADLPPGEQVGAYEEAHRALTQTLAGIDEG